MQSAKGDQLIQNDSDSIGMIKDDQGKANDNYTGKEDVFFIVMTTGVFLLLQAIK